MQAKTDRREREQGIRTQTERAGRDDGQFNVESSNTTDATKQNRGDEDSEWRTEKDKENGRGERDERMKEVDRVSLRKQLHRLILS